MQYKNGGFPAVFSLGHPVFMSRLFWAFALLCAFASWHASDLYYPWLKFQSEMWAVAGLLWVALACGLQARKQPRWAAYPAGALGWFLLLLPVLAVGHALFNPEVYVGDAALVALYAMGAFVALELGKESGAQQPAQCIEGLCWLLLVSGMFSVAEALYQWLQLEGLGMWVLRLPENVRPSGNFAQANRMALHTAAGIAAVYGLNQRGILGRWVATLAVCFLGLGVALSQSRAGWLSAALILVFAMYFCRGRRRDMVFYGALLAAISFLFWVLPAVSAALELGAIRTGRLALGSRTSLMLGFMDGALQQPWWGYGPGQIVQVQVQRAAQAIPVLVSFWSHNIVLDMALLFGFPVSFAFVVAVLLFGGALIKNCQVQENQFVLLAVIPFAVACNTEYPHAYMNSLLLFMYILGFSRCGVGCGVVRNDDSLAAKPLVSSGWLKLKERVLLLIIFVFFALGSLTVLDYYRLSYALQVARFEAARAGTFPQNYEYPKPFVLTNLYSLLYLVRENDFINMSQQEVERYRKAAFRNPYEPALRGYVVVSELHNVKIDGYPSNAALTILDSFYGSRARKMAVRKVELLRQKMPKMEKEN